MTKNKEDIEVGHHIIQRFYGWSNHLQNIHRRPQSFEHAYHILFPTMLPIERVQEILNLDSTAYNPDVVKELNQAIARVRREWIEAYDFRCFKEKNVFNNNKKWI